MSFQGFVKQLSAFSDTVGPFVDDTDFKTAETALTITASEVDIMKNGGVQGTKSDASSLTHRIEGEYSITFNGTDTNTLGKLSMIIRESGALVVRAHWQVIPAVIYDSLFGGSTNAFNAAGRVDVGEVLGSAPNALVSGRFDASLGAVAAIVAAADKLAQMWDLGVYSGSVTNTPSNATQFIDTGLPSSLVDGHFNRSVVKWTAPASMRGQQSAVSGFNATTKEITLADAMTITIPATGEYEMA